MDIFGLEGALRALDDDGRENLLNPPGRWGPWINGGAWLAVGGTPVDILLRDVDKVDSVIRDCLRGEITIDYQCGHPFGFVNAIYAAETHFGKPLWQDETLPLNGLKSLLYSSGEYPPRMRTAIVAKFLWEAEFSLACGRKAAMKGDFHYAAGSLFRTVCSWVEVLYALNDRYLMNEKGALRQVAGLDRKPADMEMRVHEAYAGLIRGEAVQSFRIAESLNRELRTLSN